jgi:hypothetical protein
MAFLALQEATAADTSQKRRRKACARIQRLEDIAYF